MLVQRSPLSTSMLLARYTTLHFKFDSLVVLMLCLAVAEFHPRSRPSVEHVGGSAPYVNRDAAAVENLADVRELYGGQRPAGRTLSSRLVRLFSLFSKPRHACSRRSGGRHP